MSEYTDILGYITGGPRINSNGLDMALAVIPATVAAGQQFQVLLLVQNATSTPIELNVALNLPGRDAARQKGRFRAQKDAITRRVRPAEVGYLALPVMCHPETAIGDDYKAGVTFNARPLTRATTLRSQNSPAEPGPMSEPHRAIVTKMRKLNFSASKRLGLRNQLDAPFKIVANKPAQTGGPKTGWHTLWNLADDGSNQQILRQYSDLIEKHLFPRMKQKQVYEPLLRTTEQRFEAAGYPLQPLEAIFIAKLLALAVLMADPGEDSVDNFGSQAFNVAVYLGRDPAENIALPRWFAGLLRAVAADERIAARPVDYLCDRLYDSLIRDVLPFAFAMIQKTTGEDMGTDNEIGDYTEKFLSLLQTGGMDFAHAYLPLVMGGIIVYDRVIVPGEALDETLRGMDDVLMARNAEWDDANDLVFLLTRELVNRSLRLFGFQI